MKQDNFSVSIVIPCYNEQANLQKGVLDKIGNFTKDNKVFKEVLIVDDGSSDGSQKVIKERYLSQFTKFRLIENSHQGKAFAIIKGIKEANSSYVFFSDFDLATPIEEVTKLMDEVPQGNNIVIGSRKLNREGAPLARKILSFGSVVLRDYFIGLKGIRDTQCGFKLFEKKAALDIISRLLVFKISKKAFGASVSAGFDMEFLFIANRLGYKIKEVPVLWRHVESRNVSFIKDAREAIKDMLIIKLNELQHKYDFSPNKAA